MPITFSLTPAPPAATIGTAYTYDFAPQATGGIAPVTFAITAGALPAGLALSGAGTLSGTPTAAGSFNFTITATDSDTVPSVVPAAFTLTVSYTAITIAPAPVLPATKLFIRSGKTQQFTAAGGSGNLAFAASLGEITPTGLYIAPGIAGEGNVSVTDRISGLSTVIPIVVESGAGLCLGAGPASC